MFSFLACRQAVAACFLAALLMLAAAPRYALAQDYGWFSLDLPQGWQAEAPADMAGTWILSLTGPDDAVHVRVLVGKTAGPPDAADVAGLLRAAAGVRDPLRRVDGQYVFRGKDALGGDSAGVVGADPAAGLYMRNSPARSLRVRSSRVVLPAPGELMRFSASMPFSESSRRTCPAIFSFASKTLRTTGICIQFSLLAASAARS